MKKTIVLSIAIVIVLSSISIFAITRASLITKYSESQITWNDGTGETIITHTNESGVVDNSYQVALKSPEDSVVWGCYTYSATGQTLVNFITNSSNKQIWISRNNWNGSVRLSSITTSNEVSYYYGSGYDVTGWDLSQITVYSSFEEFVDAAVIVINGYTPITSNELNYALPPGNIAIIETDSQYSYMNLTTVMPLQSTSFASNPWPNTTQRIGMYNSLPSALNPSTMGNVIAWQKSGNASLFGITTSAAYSENVVSNFKYIVICNPFYYPANDMEDSQYTNGNINISMDGVVNITVKNLTATVNTNTGEVENNENGSEWTGTIDPETGGITWTDQDGEPTTPTSGGNLSDPSISGFQSWLKGILQSIISIFEPAHDAIQTLSGAVGNFANWLYALYIWLPTSILSVLKAAITLSIVIGVIKVFI